MMIHAYDKLYLERARTTLARMLDFAVCELHIDLEEFFGLFIASGYAALFGSGDIRTLAGRSGVELTYDIMEATGFPHERIKPAYPAERSEEYWTGWALAYYQWESALSFAQIVRCVPITDIRAMYDPYHEMDIRQFADHMNDLIEGSYINTNLQRLRKLAGLSQSQLAEASGIPVRTLQQYEQCQKDINKAKGEYIVSLSRVLGCEAGELMERATSDHPYRDY